MVVASCHRDKATDQQVQAPFPKTESTADSTAANELDHILAVTDLLENKVQLDTLLDKITHQDRVKLISTLSITQDDSGDVYSDSAYSFRLKLYYDGEPSMRNCKTIFYDRGTKIPFEKYEVICPEDSGCITYGFNSMNSLIDPRVIEVCGRRYLYSNMEYWCNGTGCDCNLIMIYDIELKQPTFIENYRIEYNGYYISDFDGDSIPDVLLMGQRSGYAEGFNISTTMLYLYNYKWRNRTLEPPGEYTHKLLGFCSTQYAPTTYSLIQ